MQLGVILMKTLLTHKQIVKICKDIGKTLTQTYSGKTPVVICVLKGAAPFHSELIKHIDLDITVDYLQVSSYSGTESTGVITFKKDIEADISGQDVIVVEDIVDGGLTLSKLKENLKQRKPSSLTFVTLLDKPAKRKVDFAPDIIGKTIDDLFVIGFGLDYNESYRALENIYYFEEHEIEALNK